MSTLKAKQFHLIEDMDIAAMTFAAIERIESVATRVQHTVGTWISRSNERRALMGMSDHMLQDIGLSPYDVQREASKYFWQQ